MAAGDRSHSAQLRPEERLADLVVRRFELEPPVDLEALAGPHADLEVADIPGRCDGLVVGLHGGSRPLILLSQSGPQRRRRFTLAHELGHVLIPWHLGNSFMCATGRVFDDESYHAANAEVQANRFAARLLVPSNWLDALVGLLGHEQLEPLMDAIFDAEVSAHVACLRLAGVLPPGRVFALTDYSGVVVLSGQSAGTRVDPPAKGAVIERDRLDRFATHVENIAFGNYTAIWWTFGDHGRALDPELDEIDSRTSREVLDGLLKRHVASGDASWFQQSLGGVIGAENSVAKREGTRSVSGLYARFRARFASPREYPPGLLEDVDFDAWLRKRAEELGE